MSVQNDVLRENFTGRITITIQGIGTGEVEGLDQRLCFLIGEAEVMLRTDPFTSNIDINNPPYEVVSFDRDAKKLVVRKKKKKR